VRSKSFQKKIILFSSIAILAIVLGFVVVKNLQKNLKEFNQQKFLEELNLPSAKEKIKDSLEGIKKLETEIEQKIIE